MILNLSKDLNPPQNIVKKIFDLYAEIVMDYAKKGLKIPLPKLGYFKASKHKYRTPIAGYVEEELLRFYVDKSIKFLD